jgi:ABC-type uncharacterized transport system permease subunit
MGVVLLPVALLAYVLSIWMASMVAAYRSERARLWAGVFFVVAWALHFVVIAERGLKEGGLPLTNVAEYLLVFGWCVLSLHLYVWFRLRVLGAGLVLPPLAALSATAAWTLLPMVATPEPSQPAEGLLLFHVTVATLGMAILCLAFSMSVLYLLQDRALKYHQTLGLLERFPALERCDQIGLQALVVGFLFLTVGIGTGVGVNATLGPSFSMGPKEIFPLLAWLVFAVTLAARTLLGYRGTRSAYLTIAGFALGVLTVLGMTL